MTLFDNTYGLTAVKNDMYYDSEIVSVEKANYRMMEEPGTEVALFANGQATITGEGQDSVNKVLADNPEASQ